MTSWHRNNMSRLSFNDIKRILKPYQSAMPTDDFRIIDSWAEFDESSNSSIEEKSLVNLCYEIETINPNTGEKHHFFKALKFVRVIRLPKSTKQSTSLMDMQSQIMSSVYSNNVNFVTIIANIKKPVPLGLLFLYGVQGVGNTIEEAKEKAHNDFLRIVGMFQGTYRVLEMRVINAQETEWLRAKMYGMDFLTVVRGIPKAAKTGEDAGNKGFGGQNLNPESEGTLEELIIGLSDYEYVLEVLVSPVQMDTLVSWSLKTQTEMTDWNSQLQGQTSLSANVSIPMMFGASSGNSQGWSQAYTDANSINYSQGESFTNSTGESLSQSLSTSFGTSDSISTGNTFGISQSNGISHGLSQGQSISSNFGQNIGTSESLSQGTSSSQGLSSSNSLSHSLGNSSSISNSNSNGWSMGENSSQSMSNSQSMSVGNSSTSSLGQSATNSQTHSTSDSLTSSNTSNSSASTGFSHGVNNSITASYAEQSFLTQIGNTIGIDSSPDGASASQGTSDSANFSNSNSIGTSSGISTGSSDGTSVSTGSSFSNSLGTSVTNGSSVGNSYSTGTSTGLSGSQSVGTSNGMSESYSTSNGNSLSSSYGASMSLSNGVTSGQSISNGYGSSLSKSETSSYTEGISQSTSNTQGHSESASTSQGTSTGTSTSVSNGTSNSTSTGNSYSNSTGSSGSISSGISSSLGLGPSIGFSKSHQWIDQKVKDILELLEFQNERAKRALRSNGAFYTYIYLACSDMDALATAQAVAKSTWQNEFAMVTPLQVLNLEIEEQKHLLYHFSAFSTDITKEIVEGIEEYKYSTLLLSDELVAYTHLPRVSEGGVFSDINDIPKFSVPSMLKGEIYMGTILSAEKYSIKKGSRTDFDYRIDESELMHGFFTGASRSGKTVAAMRFIAELANVKRKKTGKKLRIVALDPKQDWRTLARFVEPERFNFYSLGNLNFRPIKINPWKIPRGVYPQIWIDGVIDIYCRAYGLLERGKQMMGETIYSLYEEAGVFEACDKPDWMDIVPELSKAVNFTAIQNKMENTKNFLESKANNGGRMGNDTRDAYARLLERMAAFKRQFSIEHTLFGTSEGIGIDELIGNDDVTVLESMGLENTFKNFIFGVITSGFYKFAKAHEGGYLAPDQYETVLVIEEANEILTGNDSCGTGGSSSPSLSGQSEFEQILDQSAGYGLFIFAITQKIADMPSSIIANSNLVFAGKLKREQDVTTVIRAIAREEKFEDRDLVKWFPRSPTGWFVCQSARGYDFKSAEPVLVQIARLNIKTPSNAEIDEIMTNKEVRTKVAND